MKRKYYFTTKIDTVDDNKYVDFNCLDMDHVD